MKVPIYIALLFLLVFSLSGCMSGETGLKSVSTEDMQQTETGSVQSTSETEAVSEQPEANVVEIGEEIELNNSSKTDIQGVNIYIYSKEHKKPQPMLINVLSEAAELDAMITKIGKATNTSELKSLGGMQIFRLQFAYAVNKHSKTTYKDYIYVTDRTGSGYLKEINYSADFDFETFTDEDIEQLLDQIGHSNWIIINHPFLE